MAVFRIEKTKDYTVMANHHLKNLNLSLKAKGLLSVILSLPDDWDYTLKGLALISKEGIDAIREAVRELEAEGYIHRTRFRNERGQLGAAEYVIYEIPQAASDNAEQSENNDEHQPEQAEEIEKSNDQTMDASPMSAIPQELALEIDESDTSALIISTSVTSALDTGVQASPALAIPVSQNPMLDTAILGIPMQLNTNIQNTYSPKDVNDQILNPSIHPSIKNLSIHPVNPQRLRASVRFQLEYDILCENHKYDTDRIDEIVDLIVETLCSSRSMIAVAGDELPAELVKGRLLKLDSSHIEYVLDSIKKTTTAVRNINHVAVFDTEWYVPGYAKSPIK